MCSMSLRGDQLAPGRADPQRPQPVELAVDDRHVVAELDQLRLCEVGVEALPQIVVREVRVPRNRLGPTERRPLALAIRLGLAAADRVLVTGEVAGAELLERGVD